MLNQMRRSLQADGPALRASILMPQVELGNLMYTKEDLHYTIFHRRADRYALSSERFAQWHFLASVADRAVDGDLPHRIGRSVLPITQHLGEGSLADAVAARRNSHAQGLMRPFVIVDLTPRIKPPLAGFHIRPRLTLDHLDIECPMEPLVLTLGLGMERSAMADFDPQLEQPDRQSGPLGLGSGRTPRGTVVTKNALGHSKTAEDRRQVTLNGLATFVGAGNESDAVPGVIIEHCQGVTAAGGGREMPLEIHLPELVGPIALEADESTTGGGLRTNALVSSQDRRDRAGGRHVLCLECDQAGMAFSTAPCGVLIAES